MNHDTHKKLVEDIKLVRQYWISAIISLGLFSIILLFKAIGVRSTIKEEVRRYNLSYMDNEDFYPIELDSSASFYIKIIFYWLLSTISFGLLSFLFKNKITKYIKVNLQRFEELSEDNVNINITLENEDDITEEFEQENETLEDSYDDYIDIEEDNTVVEPLFSPFELEEEEEEEETILSEDNRDSTKGYSPFNLLDKSSDENNLVSTEGIDLLLNRKNKLNSQKDNEKTEDNFDFNSFID